MATPTIRRSGSTRSSQPTKHDLLLGLYAAAKEGHDAALHRLVRASSALSAPYGKQHQREAVALLRVLLHYLVDRALDQELARLPPGCGRSHLRLAGSEATK